MTERSIRSPIEEECLRILQRGKQPLIVCPARAIDTMRISRMSYRAAGPHELRKCSKGGVFRG